MSLTIFLVLSLLLVGGLYYFMFVASAKDGSQKSDSDAGGGATQADTDPKVVNRGGAANRIRNRRATNTNDPAEQEEEEEEKERLEQWADNNELEDGEGNAMADRKFTKKELQRHEKMQQRRQQREAMAQQREANIQNRSEKDAKKEEAERKREEKDRQIEEEERKIEEEKARREQAEFEKWKALMQVEETGQEAGEAAEDTEEKNRRFIQFIERRKVVMLEDVAAEFKMQAKDVVTRIDDLEREGSLTGITDDRGKYIHITPEEFKAVAGYIESSGRVTRADLYKEANRLVRMVPTEDDKALLKQEQMDVLSKVEKTIGSDKK